LIGAQWLSMRYARAALNAVGEPLRFGIESTLPVPKHVAAFLQSCGLSLEEQRNFGQETDRKHAIGGFAGQLCFRWDDRFRGRTGLRTAISRPESARSTPVHRL